MEWRRKTQRTRYRSSSEILRQLIFIFAFLFGTLSVDASPVTVYARYDARVVHIETIGTMFNDKEEVGGASGLLIGDNLVLTNNHVIPVESNYRTLVINVRPKSRLTSPPLKARVLDRDSVRDLAILELQTRVDVAAMLRCPMPVIKDATSAPPGTEVYVMGFPLNQNLSISRGLISNQDSDNGRWQTDSVINPGNSGGPVFDGQGVLVGIAVGGIVKWTFGNVTHNVSGVNFLIPATLVKDSPVFTRISALPFPRRCWRETSRQEAAWIMNKAQQAWNGPYAPPTKLKLPNELNRTFTVSESLEDRSHEPKVESRKFSKRFEAEPQYRILSCTWNTMTASHDDDIKCTIDEEASMATFSFSLASEQDDDRQRSWWAGTVELQQERVNELSDP